MIITFFGRRYGPSSTRERPHRDARIKDLKHMWGSCGRDRVVNINWQLVLAPKHVLEYAVVHELVRLKHRSHQPVFWTTLGAILPGEFALAYGFVLGQKASLDRIEREFPALKRDVALSRLRFGNGFGKPEEYPPAEMKKTEEEYKREEKGFSIMAGFDMRVTRVLGRTRFCTLERATTTMKFQTRQYILMAGSTMVQMGCFYGMPSGTPDDVLVEDAGFYEQTCKLALNSLVIDKSSLR